MAQAPGAAEAHRRVQGRSEPVPHGRRHDGQGREKGVAEGAKESGVCGAQQVARPYSPTNKFKGLKWCQLRRIMLQGFQLEKVVY